MSVGQQIGSQRLEDIAGEVGTPTYIYNLDMISERFDRFYNAFAGVEPLIAYAVKANSNLAVIGRLAGLGAGADVVSGGELHRALAAGVPAHKIIFSGVGKSAEELRIAVELGIFQVTLESLEEALELSAIAVALGREIAVGLRINPAVPDAGGHSKISTGCATAKFGVPIEQAEAAFAAIAGLSNLKLQGVSIHIGSQMLDLKPFDEALFRLDGLIGTLRGNGHRIRTISVGGGLAVAYRPGEHVPDLAGYAALILSFARRWRAQLILEPGRWLVADAGSLLTRVIRIKQTGDRAFLVLDAGMNDFPRPSLYDAWHEIVPAKEDPGAERTRYDIVGPLCEASDLFARDRELASVSPGDLLLIGQAGAYCSSMAGNYNSRPLIPEVVLEGDRWQVARRRQTLDDLIGLEWPNVSSAA